MITEHNVFCMIESDLTSVCEAVSSEAGCRDGLYSVCFHKWEKYRNEKKTPSVQAGVKCWCSAGNGGKSER